MEQSGNAPLKRTSGTPVVSILIVTYNSADEIEPCLKSIESQSYTGELEVIVVDNLSTDDSASIVAERFPDVSLIRNNVNAGFAAANNLAYTRSSGDYVILVNPDSLLEADAIAAAVRFMERRPTCGLCGGLLIDQAGVISPSARKYPTAVTKFNTISGLAERFSSSRFFGGADFRWFDHTIPLRVDWVPGAFTCIRRAMIEELGFFDERFYLYYEETDLCYRAKTHGWTTEFNPECKIEHEGGASSRKLTGQTFDAAGSQVRRFRMLAECLYHRKNRGMAGLLAATGVEIVWHQLRRVVNFRPGSTARGKRLYSKEVVDGIRSALRETSYGKICPPRPW